MELVRKTHTGVVNIFSLTIHEHGQQLILKYKIKFSLYSVSIRGYDGSQDSISGVARLGHTEAHVLATRGRAPPVQVSMQIIGADSSIVDRESGTKQSLKLNAAVSLCISTELRVSYAHRTQVCHK